VRPVDRLGETTENRLAIIDMNADSVDPVAAIPSAEPPRPHSCIAFRTSKLIWRRLVMQERTRPAAVQVQCEFAGFLCSDTGAELES
jgi:hypothetical protein